MIKIATVKKRGAVIEYFGTPKPKTAVHPNPIIEYAKRRLKKSNG